MEYQIIRSKRRTLAMQVRLDGSIVVRAPLRLAAVHIDRFAQAHAGWAERQQARMAERRAERPEPDEAQLAAWREAALAHIPGRVAHFSALMGLTPQGVKITRARTRFGSCSGSNSLCFSCRLMGYPPPAIDYVVVHELAHIVHKNHGPDFYALVAQTLPDWQARRAMLRR